jgi:hypothetical protein
MLGRIAACAGGAAVAFVGFMIAVDEGSVLEARQTISFSERARLNNAVPINRLADAALAFSSVELKRESISVALLDSTYALATAKSSLAPAAVAQGAGLPRPVTALARDVLMRSPNDDRAWCLLAIHSLTEIGIGKATQNFLDQCYERGAREEDFVADRMLMTLRTWPVIPAKIQSASLHDMVTLLQDPKWQYRTIDRFAFFAGVAIPARAALLDSLVEKYAIKLQNRYLLMKEKAKEAVQEAAAKANP